MKTKQMILVSMITIIFCCLFFVQGVFAYDPQVPATYDNNLYNNFVKISYWSEMACPGGCDVNKVVYFNGEPFENMGMLNVGSPSYQIIFDSSWNQTMAMTMPMNIMFSVEQLNAIELSNIEWSGYYIPETENELSSIWQSWGQLIWDNFVGIFIVSIPVTIVYGALILFFCFFIAFMIHQIKRS